MTVLHTLRCIGFASLPRVSDAAGLPESEVESELLDLARAGLVTHISGTFGGWGLTEEGRAADAERIARELDAANARTAVKSAFDDFLVLNPELLDLCSAWQLRTADESRILAAFTDFHRRAEPVCADLSAALHRLQRYQVRLSDALTRARCGALDYLTDNVDSYHSVWFQLHEDLLVTLGIPR